MRIKQNKTEIKTCLKSPGIWVRGVISQNKKTLLLFYLKPGLNSENLIKKENPKNLQIHL